MLKNLFQTTLQNKLERIARTAGVINPRVTYNRADNDYSLYDGLGFKRTYTAHELLNEHPQKLVDDLKDMRNAS